MAGEFIETTVSETLRMLEEGKTRQQLLANLVGAAEKVSGTGAVSSILVLDEQGLLRNGSSPQLPLDYLTAIDGLQPNYHVGTCAAAAATGSMVMTPDFYADNKWAELRHLPLALGFSGAWSMPIKNTDGEVLGTFGTYFREKRNPSEEEISAVRSLSAAAATILSNTTG